MNPLDSLIGSVVEAGSNLLKSYFPPDLSPEQKAKLEEGLRQYNLEVQKLSQQLNLAQIETNKIEASSHSLFVAGWRPFVGWVCGVAVAYSFIGHPLLEWYTEFAGLNLTYPELDTATLMQLLFAMLGMAGLRTYEKKQGIHRDKLGK